MLDFDDLDETAAARAADGDEDALLALGAVEKPGPFKGFYLSKMRHNKQWPGRQHLPEKVRSVRDEDPIADEFQIRLFVFYGGGDSYVMWSQPLNACPKWLDVGIHEFPGHGTREDEPLNKDMFELAQDAWEGLEGILKQHAKDGFFEGAPFAFLGHSQGILQMIEVAERAKRLLALEPVAVFALDRPPPGPTGASRKGYELLTMDWPFDFYEFQEPLGSMMKNRPDDPKTIKIVKMWQNDMRQSNEPHTQRPVGFHTFNCDVHIVIALRNWDMDKQYEYMKKNDMEIGEEMLRCYERQVLIHDSGEASYFNREAYNLWDKWTTQTAHYHEMEMDHNGLKTFKEMWALVFKVLQKEMTKKSVEQISFPTPNA
mmetsp:Transcript_63681/g.136865  ORF Transcript_63681/g.136865 Transcript_63681/m.136865 type:complete len:372 (+) Transcript_63681:104-1219(+)